MASGKLNMVMIVGKSRSGEYKELSLKKQYTGTIWKTNTNISSKKWTGKASDLTKFINQMNEDRKLKNHPKSRGVFIYELRGFASYGGMTIPSKLYETELREKIPYCCFIRGYKGDGLSLLSVEAKRPEEFIAIGTGKYKSPDEDKVIEQCIIPLVFTKNDDGTYESINQF